MIRTNSEHHFSSFVKTHVSYTVFHVVKSGKGFFLLFGNVNPAIFANSYRKFMAFSRQGTFFGRATITDGLSTFPAMVLPMEKSDRYVISKNRDNVMVSPKPELNFSPEGALLPGTGFEPTTFCGH